MAEKITACSAISLKLIKKGLRMARGETSLEALMDFFREGDTVIVHSMDRLARNLDDLSHLIQTLTRRGIQIEFKKTVKLRGQLT